MARRALTVAEVKAAARKAYDKGVLMFQKGDAFGMGFYTYRVKGSPNFYCPVGAALTEAELDVIDRGSPLIPGLDLSGSIPRVDQKDLSENSRKWLANFPVRFQSSHQRQAIAEIQRLHDSLSLCNSAMWGNQTKYTPACEEFLKAIDHPSVK